MTSMMACDENLRNAINPYTATGTFGVSWNGGYKPDDSLEYVRPYDNIVKPSIEDDFVPPMYITPSNIYLKTQEARRDNIMTGGVPTRIYEDRVCEFQETQLEATAPPPTAPNVLKESRDGDNDTGMANLLLFIIVALATIFLVSLKHK